MQTHMNACETKINEFRQINETLQYQLAKLQKDSAAITNLQQKNTELKKQVEGNDFEKQGLKQQI